MNIICWQFTIGMVVGLALGGLIATCIELVKFNNNK